VHIDNIKLLLNPAEAQLNIPRKILKFTLQSMLRVLQHVSVSTTIIRERGICASRKL